MQSQTFSSYAKVIRTIANDGEKQLATRYLSNAKLLATKNPEYANDQLMLVRHILTNHCGIDANTLPQA